MATATVTPPAGTLYEVPNIYVDEDRTIGNKIKGITVHNHGPNPLWFTTDGSSPTVNDALPVVGPGDQRLVRLNSLVAVDVKLISSGVMTYSVEATV
jgi:hypothetical protein